VPDVSPAVPRYADPSTRIGRVFSPFREFTRTEVSGGILLFIATLIALVWANSPWGDSYGDFWHTTLTIGVGGSGLTKSLAHWINDGLMVIFFFVVGLEIKREVMVGELATRSQAALPIAAAAGGAIVPALIYYALNAGGAGAHGWGVPMATDIAFALGVMAILGDRIPLSLRIFVTALAIVDDLIAVLVIALFYTEQIELMYLLAGAGIFALLVTANRLDVTRPVIYGGLGMLLWFTFVKSGVHATIAGVLLAMTIPARTLMNSRQFLQAADGAMADFREASANNPHTVSSYEQQSALQDLESAVELVQSPMQRFEHKLHPWTSFVIVPIFALANAGVAFGSDFVDVLVGPVSLGVILGLIFGKQIGITTVTWLMVRMGWSSLPEGVTMRHIHGASCLAGIGFTMSLFIGELAFVDADLRDEAKVGIFVASTIAGIVGFIVLRALGNGAESNVQEDAHPEPAAATQRDLAVH
jgi:Na+:H+ antiporter, NhaA family